MDIMARRLRTLREKMGMSQAKLAKEIGVTQASVNRYETARTTPPVKILLFYADRFDVSRTNREAAGEALQLSAETTGGFGRNAQICGYVFRPEIPHERATKADPHGPAATI